MPTRELAPAPGGAGEPARGAGAAPSPNQLTIEQLAAHSGMSVRNIRAHQARGLLAGPEVRLRVGYYGPAHVAQLRLIRQLQEQGFNLSGIKRLLDDETGTAERLAHFERALTSSPHSEAPQTLTTAELGRRFAVSAHEAPCVLARAQRLGVLVCVGEDRFQAPSPSLLAVAERVVDRGISLDGALAVFEELACHCDAISGAFVSVFMREVWQPFAQAGMPVERWPEIDESIKRLRPLATDALLAIFGQRMSAQIESGFGALTRAQPLGEASGDDDHEREGFAMTSVDPDTQRAESLARWERSAPGWGRRAARLRPAYMAVSTAMIDELELVPGQRVLELAAGPGDVGFLAAELISPGGTLICSDGTEGMLEVARARAAEAGIDNVEFAQLQLEWIDLPTASVDAVLCRFGIMLIVDPPAAAQEIRRVVRPGGRAALAVWNVDKANPWATVPNRAMVELGLADPPDRDAPGMFRLAAPGALAQLLETAGFGDVRVRAVPVDRSYPDLDAYLEETRDLSAIFRESLDQLTDSERADVQSRIAKLAEPYSQNDGSLQFPASALVAGAGA